MTNSAKQRDPTSARAQAAQTNTAQTDTAQTATTQTDTETHTRTDARPDRAFEPEARAVGPGAEARTEQMLSVTGLVRKLIGDATHLFEKELAMATAEILQSVREAKAGLGGSIVGGAVLYAGFLFLLVAATYGLAEFVEMWAAALIVGAVAVLVGAIMLQAAKRRMRPRTFVPEHAAAAMHKDREMVGRQLS